MSQYVETPCRTFQAGAAIAQFLRVKITSSKLAVAGVGDDDMGTIERASFADLDYVPVRLMNAQGTRKMVAGAAVTAFTKVYQAASGKIDDAAAGKLIGTALEAATADGDIIEVAVGGAAATSTPAAIAANGDTLTVTEALHAGKIVQFGKTTGTIVTLPAATGTGNIYRFVIGVAATSNANIIKVANATDVMDGSLNLQADDDVDGTSKTWMAEVGDDTMTFAGAATTGGIVGGMIECWDYKAGFWACIARTISSGGSEATPFSATVS